MPISVDGSTRRSNNDGGSLTYVDRDDVAILGSGIGGSMLACILAKQGLSTLLIEELTHPRFAIGESLIPETGVRLTSASESGSSTRRRRSRCRRGRAT